MCRDDVLVFTLNRVPPRYVSSRHGLGRHRGQSREGPEPRGHRRGHDGRRCGRSRSRRAAARAGRLPADRRPVAVKPRPALLFTLCYGAGLATGLLHFGAPLARSCSSAQPSQASAPCRCSSPPRRRSAAPAESWPGSPSGTAARRGSCRGCVRPHHSGRRAGGGRGRARASGAGPRRLQRRGCRAVAGRRAGRGRTHEQGERAVGPAAGAAGRPGGLLVVTGAGPPGGDPSFGARLRTALGEASRSLYGDSRAAGGCAHAGAPRRHRSRPAGPVRAVGPGAPAVHLGLPRGPDRRVDLSASRVWCAPDGTLRWSWPRSRARPTSGSSAGPPRPREPQRWRSSSPAAAWPAPCAERGAAGGHLPRSAARRTPGQCSTSAAGCPPPRSGAPRRFSRWTDAALGRSFGWRTLGSSVGATLATAPITAWALGTVAPVGIALNFAAIPIAAVAVPGVLVSLLLLSGVAGARAAVRGRARASRCTSSSWWPPGGAARAGRPSAARAGAWRRARCPGSAPSGSVSGSRPAQHAGTRRARRAAWAATAGAVGCTRARGRRSARVTARRGLTLHFLDVGQGDAALLRTPGGHWILVDAGPAGEGIDAGRRVVAPFLQRRGVAVALRSRSSRTRTPTTWAGCRR